MAHFDLHGHRLNENSSLLDLEDEDDGDLLMQVRK